MLETLRADNWTFFGVPTAQIVSLAFIAVGVVGMVLRHRAEPDGRQAAGGSAARDVGRARRGLDDPTDR